MLMRTLIYTNILLDHTVNRGYMQTLFIHHHYHISLYKKYSTGNHLLCRKHHYDSLRYVCPEINVLFLRTIKNVD